MRILIVIAAVVLAAIPAAADDSRAITESLGGLSIATQICGFEIDRERLQEIGRALLPAEPDPSAEFLRVENRIAGRQGSWSTDERVAWCETARDLAHRLGVMR